MDKIVIVPIGYFPLEGKKYYVISEDQLHDVTVASCVDVEKVNALLEKAELEDYLACEGAYEEVI